MNWHKNRFETILRSNERKLRKNNIDATGIVDCVLNFLISTTQVETSIPQILATSSDFTLKSELG